MTGREGGSLEAPRIALLQVPPGRYGMRQDGGLRVGRELELFLRPLEAQARKRKTEHRVRLLEDRPRRGRHFVKFPPHADELRALAGKEEGEHLTGVRC